MGHKRDDTFQAYIGRISGVDVQRIIVGKDPDQDLIDWVASMQTDVDRGGPVRHGSLLVHTKRRNHPSSQTGHGIDSDLDEAYDPFDGTETATPFNVAKDRGPPSRQLRTYLKYDTPRSDFITIAQAQSDPRVQSLLHQTVAPLCAMASPIAKPWNYPGAQPSACGTCSYCGLNVSDP